MSLAPQAGFEPQKGRTSPVLLSKTCQNCFMLKIRCDRTQRNDICDRCARLGKNCVFRPARRRDNSAKRDSRIQALEAQVQALLHNGQSSSSTIPTIPEGSAPAPSSSSTRSPPPPPLGDVVDEDILTIERAETLVELYKSDMMPHFPFIMIPQHITGSQLRQEKYFLFLAIVSVACFHDLQTQDKLADRFKYLVSEKVLLGGDDSLSLDYLQGLLISLAWNQYHGRSKYYSQYLQLAISIAVDMRLDRKPIRSKTVNPGSKRDPLVAGQPGTQTWGSEEQRAAAGIFYLSSTISKLLDKMNTFPCTQFIEEGCLALRQKAEYRTDQDLYHVIRLQRIIENIETLANQSSSDTEAQAGYLRVRAELEEFRAFLVSDVSDSHLLFMQFHTAKLFLYQVAFFERNLQHHPALNISILCEGLESAKSFLDLYLWLPPKSEMALTNSEWIQLSFGVTLAAKFAIVSKDPNVELQTRDLRHRLNIDNVFRHLALRIGALVGRAGEGNKQKDIFYHYELRVRKIQNWFEKMVRATGSDSPMSQQASMMAAQNAAQSQRSQHPHSSSAGSTPSSHVSLPSTGYQPQQQQMGYAHPQMASAPMASTGMAPMTSYSTYNSAPILAFPDLMAAPGWDMPFTIPMEDNAWVFDVPAGYQGMNVASPPSDGTWGSPSNI
ncbi:hypothetical protein BDV96DRAFT_601122 [Lophiotrema nucula]|uniref:Zn(2)-C6 fungal-type domain-containing protein n=1 Tax=Lophiotrema nucula TaxID=690887 RepID=A0A6A5Z421_9PLEO|nr:hypothetical protein BDV96DRAFT_601122 [Lophiotrema nucula]